MNLKKRKRQEIDTESLYENLPRRHKNHQEVGNRLLVRNEKIWTTSTLPNSTSQLPDTSKVEHQSDDIDVNNLNGNDEIDGNEASESRWNDLLTAKEELAKLASLINEDPENHLSALHSLADISKSTNLVVAQLAFATRCAVFKDIIPGYRIRSITDEESKEKVSKDVKKLRRYEQGLVTAYHDYIKELSSILKSPYLDLRSASISCASTLLLAVPHFNFRSDLVKIVLHPLTRTSRGKNYDKSCQTIRKLFREDEDGHSSLEVVTTLTKSMRQKDYNINETLLDLFLHLRLLSEFGLKGSYNQVDRKNSESLVEKKIRRRKESKVHKSKRNRKIEKEQRELAKELREADAIVGDEERERLQAEMLKMVFATYFRILKDRVPHLMGSVLEGLAKYSHLINQDFFGDILEALKDLIKDTKDGGDNGDDDNDDDDDGNGDASNANANDERDRIREALLCNITAFALLQGQDGKSAMSNLHLDLSFFVTHLFNIIIPLSMDHNIELGPKSLLLSEEINRKTKVNAKTKSVLLIRCLSSVLLPSTALRLVPPIRIAAFTKNLLTLALQLPEKSCQALIGLLVQTSKVHGRHISALWNTEERKGDGVFNSLNGTIESSNPYAATVWECELLRLHFSPKVKEALDIVMKNIRAVQ